MMFLRAIIFILILIVSPAASYAGNVSVDRAKDVAEKFFIMKSTRADKPVLMLKDSPKLQELSKRETSAPAFYVFTCPTGGFVIVSGDDSIEPILGYSFDSEFCTDDLPAHIEWWLSQLGSVVEYASKQPHRQSSSLSAKWECPVTVTRSASQKLLKTAKWGQDPPYNIYCPVINESRAVTGCVATATAIIMRYHCWPLCGQGSLGDYSYTYRGVTNLIKGYKLGHQYEWHKMPLDTPKTDEEIAAVAQLMLDCGVMSKMMYTPEASAAYVSDAAFGLRANMLYSDNMTSSSFPRDLIPNEAIEIWKQQLISNIDNYGPILYAAYGDGANSEGHAFVVDGYDSEGMFHINFGWSGFCNGFFAFPDFGGFYKDHYAYLRIRKKSSSDIEDSAFDNTSFEYLVKEKTINISTLPNIELTILHEGNIVDSGVAPSDGNISFKTADYNSGIYTIRLSNGPETKEFKFKITR